MSAVLATAEEEKKHKYLTAADSRHASFTPFVVSVDGALGHEASMFCSTLLRSCLVVGVKVMVMCLRGFMYAWPLL